MIRLRSALALLLLVPPHAEAQPAGARDFLDRAEARAATLPVPATCRRPVTDAAGIVREDPLPSRIPGEARGTTGGLGHRLLLVRDTAEGDASAAGTIRWAVEKARQDGGGWIAFAPELAGRTINLSRGLRLPSNTTIDGGCEGVVLYAPAYQTTLLVQHVQNVLVAGLRFTKSDYSEPDTRIADAIGLRGRFDRVALLNNHFSRCGDGCIDVVRSELTTDPGRVSVAYNRIESHNKVMLAGVLTCTARQWLPECAQPLDHLAGRMRPMIRVSLVANVFLLTGQRHPKADAGAFVHSVNNLTVLAPTIYSDGRSGAAYGAAAASGGLIASEGDILVNPTAQPRLGLGPVSAMKRAGDVSTEADGAVAANTTILVGRLRVVQHAPDLALAELAAETAPIPVIDPTRDPTQLAACLLRFAGPQGAASSWPDVCAAR
ncbi:hypothetical protein D9599_07285 [Roseomonas sp. KE2513]|uniref:hypothetical protein n=1 Tax=Roseomonas sp. KE2513 TaxID=2479202 RepID=UPI0018E03BC5|nr:hypothetical protein [Roseomonas sp. KE2513]MBI0535370.1 hypothetical protein [Roseomonas sp. KE2513]